MQIFISVLMLLLIFWVSPANAVAPVNGEAIEDARSYGFTKTLMDIHEFLSPWTAYEENAVKISEATDRAVCYTPFLLIANDAREKAKVNKTVNLADIEKLLADYAGYYTFTVILQGSTADFAEKSVVVIIQDKKTISAYDIAVTAAESVNVPAGEKPRYRAQMYIYFHAKDIAANQPIVLKVKTSSKDSKESKESKVDYSFYFDLAKIK